MEDEPVIALIKRSRKIYILEYCCSFLLLIFSGWVYFKGIVSSIIIFKLVFSLALLILLWVEISRLVYRYKITPTKITMIQGLLRQHKKHVYFQPLAFVPDLNVHQSAIQRILDYGTISIMGQSDAFQIRDIDHPHEIIKMLEELIDQNKPSRQQRAA